MKDFKESATEIARETGTFLRDRFNSVHTISYKGEINLVTEADKISEEMITSEINHLFPDHDILAEEFAYTSRGSDFRWIIDPLQKLDEIILGVIYNPILKEMFVAEKGEGAFLNGREIQVSNTLRIAQSFIATGFPYDIREDSQNNLDYFNKMIMRARAIRRAGSAALDLAYVAAGRFDGFWELKLSPWDTAAGWLIVEEAGGVVTDFSGQEYFLESPGILASNGRIHKEMMDVLREASSIS
jgi:myo-inositol-1(or 4)-monophosphatase